MVTILQEIISVFKKKNNSWLDYNEIYDLMDKSLFGPNKHGERGKRNIVYRLILGNELLFDEDTNHRPKKFRLKTHIMKEKNLTEIETIYSTGDTKIFSENNKYEEVKFTYEADFEKELKENHKLVFGEDTIYYDIKKKLGDRICDAIVFNPKTKKVFIVEAELFTHSLYGHIIPQITGFFNAMKDEQTRHKLKYDIDWKEHKLNIIEALDKSDYDIIVVIDRITFEIKETKKNISELIKNFAKHKKNEIVFKEFNVFIDENQNKIFRVK